MKFAYIINNDILGELMVFEQNQELTHCAQDLLLELCSVIIMEIFEDETMIALFEGTKSIFSVAMESTS